MMGFGNRGVTDDEEDRADDTHKPSVSPDGSVNPGKKRQSGSTKCPLDVGGSSLLRLAVFIGWRALLSLLPTYL
jgi:hypothetical protein